MADTNPITTAFDLQRSAIEQTHQLTHEALEAQKTAANVFVDGLENVEQIQEQNTELSYEAINAYLDAVEQVVPEANVDDLRELVDDSYDSFEEFQEETWEAVHQAAEDGVANFESAADSYGEFVDSSFDTYLQAYEQVEASAEEFEEIDVSAD